MENTQTQNNFIQYNTVSALYLSDYIVTSVDINNINVDGIITDNELCAESSNPVENRVLYAKFNEISEQLEHLEDEIPTVDEVLDELNIDNELCAESSNPVANNVLYTKFDEIKNKLTEILNTLTTKYDKENIDKHLNQLSPHPVANSAITELITSTMDRITRIEYINNIQLSYSTDLEVFATRNTITSGSVSSKEVFIDRMFAQTNKWNISKTYLSGTIVTLYNNKDLSPTQTVGIYRAIKNVPANTEITETNFWEDLTATYIEKKPVTEIDKDGKEVPVEKYFHKFIEDVPAGTVQTLILKSETKPEEQNVIIVWGDGAKTNLRAAIDEDNAEGVTCINDEDGYVYTCRHDYARSLVDDNGDQIESKYFMIEIVGNKFSILTSGEDNIISNIFGDNMQFYLNCIDVEGLCKGSKKLLYISCADYNSAITSIRNTKSMFEDCTNLQYAIGFYELTGINTMLSMGHMFARCKNMLNCDCRIAKSVASKDDNGNTAVYLDCKNMSSRLRALLPTNGFDQPYVKLDSTFKNCKNIYISDKVETGEKSDKEIINIILFNDTSKTFEHNETFSGCDLINSIDGFIPDDWK